MIGRLRGILLEKQPPALLIDIQGVGYEVDAPMSTFYQLPETGQEVTLFTHLLVREDAQLLYGFSTELERRLFRNLLKVSGVGAKVALAILSGMNADEFAGCIQQNDVTSLTRIPGIGKKTAERLIVEMRDRLADWEVSGSVTSLPSGVTVQSIVHDPVADAVSALIALGYKPNDASRHVAAFDKEGQSSEDLIRQALKAMVK